MVLQAVKTFIANHQLIDKSDKIGLAISGGKDSVCMAYLLEQLCIPFAMVHINFCLRGKESDTDARFVTDLGASLSHCYRVYSKSVDTASYAKKQKKNTQLAAREIRYTYFEALKSTGAFTKLITAHHQSDLVETFFINLNRHSGISGLKSIPTKRDYIIRPLMAVNSAQIIQYLEDHHIAYRQDSSNESNKYTRNKWRNVVLPTIEETISNFESNVAHSISILQQENEVLDWLMQEKIAPLVSSFEDHWHIDKQRLADFYHPALFLFQMLKKFGFNMPQCTQILGETSTTGALFFSETHVILVDRESYRVQPISLPDTERVVIPGPGTYTLSTAKIELKATTKADFTTDKKKETASIGSDMFPLTLRYWQKGDRIQPLGMSGSKLLSDFFIDEKINVIEKYQIPLICKGRDVLWICGKRMSEKLRVSKQSTLYTLYIY